MVLHTALCCVQLALPHIALCSIQLACPYIALFCPICLPQNIITLRKAASVVEERPEARVWLQLLRYGLVPMMLPYLALLFLPWMRKDRRKRGAFLVSGSIASTIPVLCMLSMEQYSISHGAERASMRNLYWRQWGLLAWKALALPLLQQLSVRDYATFTAGDVVAYGAMFWLLQQGSMSPLALLGALFGSDAVGFGVALLMEWWWRDRFWQRQVHKGNKEGVQEGGDVKQKDKQDDGQEQGLDGQGSGSGESKKQR